jgi:hypothetical protein
MDSADADFFVFEYTASEQALNRRLLVGREVSGVAEPPSMELRSPHSIHSRKRGGRDGSCEDAAEHQNAIGNLAGQVPFLGHDKMSGGVD